MKKILLNSLSLMAVLSLFNACNNDDDSSFNGPVELNIPDVELYNPIAKTSIADEEIDYLEICPVITDGTNGAPLTEEGYYYYYKSDGKWTTHKGIVSAKGTGKKSAAIWGWADLLPNENRPRLDFVYYEWQGEIDIDKDGNFKLNGSMKPAAAAIQLQLMNNGRAITDSEELAYYGVRYHALKYFYALKYTTLVDGNYGFDYIFEDQKYTFSAEKVFGDYAVGTYGADGKEWTLLEIVRYDTTDWYNEYGYSKPDAKEPTLVTTVTKQGQLVLEPGMFLKIPIDIAESRFAAVPQISNF